MRYLCLTALAAVVAIVATVGAGCGGAVDEGGSSPSPAPSTNTPSSVTNESGCSHACGHMAVQCHVGDVASCEQSCAESFDSSEQRLRYATCIEALSCADLERGATMDYGPIGECWSRARGR